MFLHDNLTDSPHIFVFIGPAFPKVGLFFCLNFLEASVYELVHKRRLEKLV